MKKRILIIAHTYYQMIMAIQMRYTNFKEAEITLLLSDYSRGAKEVCERLNSLKVFEKCCLLEMQPILHQRNGLKKIRDVIEIAFKTDNSFAKELEGINNLFFDEFVCYNYRIDTYGIYSILSNYNPFIKMSFMEEGILSYHTSLKRTKARNFVGKMRHLRGKKELLDSLGNAYCFYPVLYDGEFQGVEVPPITSDSECVTVLRKVFQVDGKTFHYNQPYIFFTSVYDFEGGKPIGEYELVCKIADYIGKENLLIKEHPRDKRNLYTGNGFTVDSNSGIPWEVIQLSADFSDKVFMTATSGSVLAGSFMSEKPTKTLFMYKLCDISGNYAAQITSKDIYNLLKNTNVKSVLNRVRIADSIEEILE